MQDRAPHLLQVQAECPSDTPATQLSINWVGVINNDTLMIHLAVAGMPEISSMSIFRGSSYSLVVIGWHECSAEKHPRYAGRA